MATKILAIGASSNQQSINQILATYTARLAKFADVEELRIADYELPLFTDERERALGQPDLALAFFKKIGDADAIVISFAEHNGSYPASCKNIFDWASRIDTKVFQNKPALFLSTSPGAGGAASVLKSAVTSAGFFGAELVGSVSVPSFHQNYDLEARQISNPEIRDSLQNLSDSLVKHIGLLGGNDIEQRFETEPA